MTTLSLFRPSTIGPAQVRPVTAFWNRLARAWARWTTADALSQLSDDQLRDIGLRRDQIPEIAERSTRTILIRPHGAC